LNNHTAIAIAGILNMPWVERRNYRTVLL